MRAWRNTRSTSSLSACRRSLRTALVSTSSSRLEPPCRSRPSTIWRCAQLGQRATVFSEKKFGTAKRHTTSAKSRIAAAFHRVKNNMEFAIPRFGHNWRAVPRPASGAGERLLRSTCADFLGRLALGTHLADHRAHLLHADAVRNFDLDLVVVRHLRDLADEAAVGDDDIAPAQRLHHVLMLLHLLLLRPQDQEVHDHDDQNERRKLDKHVVSAAGAAQAELRVYRADDQHCSSRKRSRNAPAPPKWPISRRNRRGL